MTINRGVKSDRNETCAIDGKMQGSNEIDATNRKKHNDNEKGVTNRKKNNDNEKSMTDRKKQSGNETGRKDWRKPVKIIVKPIYAGKQDMSEVFGSVALDNIRRKMQEN